MRSLSPILPLFSVYNLNCDVVPEIASASILPISLLLDPLNLKIGVLPALTTSYSVAVAIPVTRSPSLAVMTPTESTFVTSS